MKKLSHNTETSKYPPGSPRRALSLIIWMLIATGFLLFLMSCKPDDESLIVIEPELKAEVDNGTNCSKTVNVYTTDWSIELGGTSTSPEAFTLRHTSGVANMAITGGHTALQTEFCNQGVSTRVPDDIDPEHDRGFGSGLAGQVQYGDYIVAMYHPRPTFPDHFLVYDTIDGSWERWDLGMNESGANGINEYYALKPFEYLEPTLVKSGSGFKTGE